MRIDAYGHDVPEEFYKAMGEFHPSLKQELHEGRGGFFDYERRIDHLDEFGIDKQIIAVGGPQLWKGVNPSEEALSIARIANDEIKKVADSYPDRYIPVGTLPIADTNMMLEEFDRCMSELDMAGIQIFSNYEGRPIDDEWLHPIYEKAERDNIPIWLHPQNHDWFEWSDQWGLDITYGWLFETTMALARLVLSGVMERFSDLNIITHHAGAMIPHFMARTDQFYGPGEDDGVISYDELDANIERPINEYFQRFYGDTALNGGVHALETAYEFYGPDHMVFATDYPYGANGGRDFMSGCTSAVENLDIPDRERERIFGENILELIE